MNVDKNVFAENLNRLMNRYGYSRKDISTEFGVPYRTVCNWCNGVSCPQEAKLKALASWFGLDTSVLINPIPKLEFNVQADTDVSSLIEIINNGKWWNYLSDDIPEEHLDQFTETIDTIENYLKLFAAPTVCEGCKHIGLRFPYPAMHPCASCVRAHRKDYYVPEQKEK